MNTAPHHHTNHGGGRQARPRRLISLREVSSRVGLGKTTIYNKAKVGEFPRPVRCGRLSRWVEQEVDAWIAERVQDRDDATCATCGREAARCFCNDVPY